MHLWYIYYYYQQNHSSGKKGVPTSVNYILYVLHRLHFMSLCIKFAQPFDRCMEQYLNAFTNPGWRLDMSAWVDFCLWTKWCLLNLHCDWHMSDRGCFHFDRSTQGAPDWTCVVVGFTSGFVRMYTEVSKSRTVTAWSGKCLTA